MPYIELKVGLKHRQPYDSYYIDMLLFCYLFKPEVVPKEFKVNRANISVVTCVWKKY